MKHEWKKHEKDLYGVKDKPQIITIPPQKFIMIKGSGDPNKADFAERVGILYSLAYPIKMRLKNKAEFNDYSVYPLEGIWTTSNIESPLDKNFFQYTIMIRQPDYVSKDLFELVLNDVKKKKPNPLLNEVIFDTSLEEKCIQMLHTGSFDDEPASFLKMDEFTKEVGLTRIEKSHREIYLNDARKTIPEKRKTILRYRVK